MILIKTWRVEFRNYYNSCNVQSAKLNLLASLNFDERIYDPGTTAMNTGRQYNNMYQSLRRVVVFVWNFHKTVLIAWLLHQIQLLYVSF